MRINVLRAYLRRIIYSLAAAFMLAALSGCGEMTSASMRVDIDVYQGSLSMEPEAQWGALYGQVEDGLRRLDQIIYSTACVKKLYKHIFAKGVCPESIANVYAEPFRGAARDKEEYLFEKERSLPGVVWDEYRVGQGQYLGGRIKQLCSAQSWMGEIKDTKVRALTVDICALRNRLEKTFDFVADWDTAYRAIRGEIALRSTSDPKTIIAMYERGNGTTDTINAAQLRVLLVDALADVAAIAEEKRIKQLQLLRA